MNRLFILASAAIVALASCTKTEVVYNEAPQEIGFKAVTGMITKAEQTDATLDGDMGVFAYVHGGALFFGNTQFTNAGAYWTGSKFWPVTNALDFIVYAPYVDGTTYNPTSKILTVAADNSSKTAIGDQVDYLYGDNYYNNNGAGFDKNTESVSVTLKHAQAKVSVSFTGADVTVTNVYINAPVLKGSYEVDYTDSPAEVTWDRGEANSLVNVIETADLSATPISGSLLVVPGTPSQISFS